MNANEMPERIYLFDYNEAMVTPLEGDTVYVREDAFIEKACAWIKENLTNNPNANSVLVRNGCVTLGMLIEDFKKYMEGEKV